MRSLDRAVPDVGHDADDFCALLESARPIVMSCRSDRRSARTFGRGFIDEHDSRMARPVSSGKNRPCTQLNADVEKYSGVAQCTPMLGIPVFSELAAARRREWWLLQPPDTGGQLASQRIPRRAALEAIGELRKKTPLPLRRCSRARQIDPGGQHTARATPIPVPCRRAALLIMSPAPASSTSASAICAVTSAPRAPNHEIPCGPASAAGPHRLDRTQRRRLHGRHQRNERRHDGRDTAGKQQRCRVETDHAGTDAGKAVGTGDAPRAWRHRRAEKHIGVRQQRRRASSSIPATTMPSADPKPASTGSRRRTGARRDAARADRRSHGHFPPLAHALWRSRRFVRFTHAINSTSPTAPSSTSAARRRSPSTREMNRAMPPSRPTIYPPRRLICGPPRRSALRRLHPPQPPGPPITLAFRRATR